MKTPRNKLSHILVNLALLLGLLWSAPQAKAQTRDGLPIETVAAISLQTFLKFDYKIGSGRSISVNDLKTYLAKINLSLSSLPEDIVDGIKTGTIEAFMVRGVPNPSLPGTFGDVVQLRDRCNLLLKGCTHRGLLIQPPTFFGNSESIKQGCWCERCGGCQGGFIDRDGACQPITCICTMIPCDGALCKGCARCAFSSCSPGTFAVSSTEATVGVHDRLAYSLSWTVPDPRNWHDLEFLSLRIRDTDNTILWVLFEEASGTFSLVDTATGHPVEAGFPAGSPNRLQTPHATLYLAETSVLASGPTSPTVILNLSLSFKPSAAARIYSVEVAASDEFGDAVDFTQAGTLTITPLK